MDHNQNQLPLDDDEFLELFTARYKRYSYDAKRCLQKSLEKFHLGTLEHGPLHLIDQSPMEWMSAMTQEYQDLMFYGPIISTCLMDVLAAIRELKNEGIVYTGPEDPRKVLAKRSRVV